MSKERLQEQFQNEKHIYPIDGLTVFSSNYIAWLENQIKQLKAENERLKSFIKDIRDNYDCDENGHGYSTGCRCCEAKELLEVLNKE